MIEVERKFRISESTYKNVVKEIEDFPDFTEATHQIDTVFLFQKDSFDTFVQGEAVVRLRVINESCYFTLKKSINHEGDSLEYEFSIGSYDQMYESLKQMQYIPVSTVDKIRHEHKDASSNITIVADRVKDLGYFVEIESLVDQDNVGAAETAIMQKALSLGLTEKDIEPRKYDFLMSER